MKSLTRREVLHGLAAGCSLAMLGPLAHAAMRQQEQPVTNPFQRVNVIFHGMFVADFGTDEVDVYAPSVSEHGYLAGTWMQEAALSQGQDYRLSGVVTGPRPDLGNLSPKENAIFARRTVDSSYSFCRLILPFPDHVATLRMFKRIHGKDFFQGTPQPLVKPLALPDVVVFTYTRPDATSLLECKPLTWTPVVQDGIVNLHVWALPSQTPSTQHTQQAFQQLGKLMGAPTLQLNPIYLTAAPPPPDTKPAVQGVSCQEELSLIERQSGAAACGQPGGVTPLTFTPYDCIFTTIY